jgi:DNA polymerase-3 subunit gamma/tau
VSRFFADLEAHLRGLMIVQTLQSVPDELRMTPDQDERLAEQARRVPPATVTHLLDNLADGLRAMKDGADARTQLELALVKAADPARDASQKALLARLERLERGGVAGTVSPAPTHAPEQPQTAAGQMLRKPDPEPEPEPEPALESPAEPVAPPPTVNGEVSLEELRELWPAVVEQLEGGLQAMLAGTVPLAVEGSHLTVAFSQSAMVLFKHADKPANRDAVAAAVQAVTGRALRVKYELRSDEELEVGEEPEFALSEHDLVDRMLHEFDATEEEPT